MLSSLQATAKDAKDDFWTRPDVTTHCVQVVKELIFPLLKKQLFYIDTSAGSNQAAIELGVPYYSTDLYADKYPHVQGKVHQGDWLKTTLRQHLTNLDRRRYEVAIGWNFPFGIRHKLIHAFVDHAIKEFKPEWFFMIVPQKYEMNANELQWYDRVYSEALMGDAFYRPLTGQPQGGLICDFRIYRRRSTPRAIDQVKREQVEAKQAQIYPPHPLVDVFKLADFDENNVDPEKVLIARVWGRSCGREWLEPQENGTLLNYKDLNPEPRYAYKSFSDFRSEMSPDCFKALVFKMPINRSELRQKLVEEWYKMAPHSFDSGNTVQMSLSGRKINELMHRALVT